MSVFEITIRRKEKDTWPVVAIHQPPAGGLDVWTEGELNFDPRTLEPLPPSEKEYGLLLGKALFAEEIRDAFNRAVAEAKAADDLLRVLLHIEAHDLRPLHWEKLHALFDRGWDYLLLNQGTPFSLYLPSKIARRFSPISRRHLSALLLVAGPEELNRDYGLSPFNTAATVGNIRHALGEIPSDALAPVEGAIGPPTLNALCEHLTSGHFTLLHVVCHGRVMADSSETVLYFPGDDRGRPVRATTLIERLSRLDRLPHFALFSTCESADPSAETGLGGLGQRLVRDLGMPAVLSMTDRISISTAQALTAAFYARLSEHLEVDRALCEALSGLQERHDVTVPALFSRLGGLSLFSDKLDHPGEPYIPRLLQTIAKHRTELRQQLEDEAHVRWGGMSAYIQEEGATLPIEASPYETDRLGPRQNLLELLHAADRLLVLGEAGSGKTVALERLAWELCGELDRQESTIPVLVRLFHYAGAPLEQWVRSRLQATSHLRLDDERALRGFLKRGDARCFFLFDGLNEVAPPYRDRLVEDLVHWMAEYPGHPVVLTSRPQDELWRRLRAEVGQAVMMQAIKDEQARAYLVTHLGERGQALYWQLDQRLQEMARMPLILWLVKEAGKVDGSVPGNRGELYDRFISRMLRRDTDRRMDAEIPERVKRQALADLAYHLGLEQRLTCRREEAEDIISRRLEKIEVQDVVDACAHHGLLAGEETVWFSPHQTVQEHFAALALRDLAEQEWGKGRWGQIERAGRRLLTGQRQGVAGLATDDWWMETFVQLAGLVDDADHLARVVAQANPWLAWWCVEEGRAVSEATRVWVEDRSAGLLHSERVADRRRAVQDLVQMRSDRAVDTLFRAAADPDDEIAGLAAGALLQMGESADLSEWVTVRNAGADIVAVAVVTAIESFWAIRGIKVELSSDQLYKKAKQRDGYSGDGTWIRVVKEIAESDGVDVKAGSVPGSGKTTYKAQLHRLASLEEIPSYLNMGRPIVAGCRVYTNWLSSKTGEILVPSEDDRLEGHWTITVVKYDLTDGSLVFAQHWGEEWGNRGFGSMSKEAVQAYLLTGSLWAVRA
jgi:hypothetical protein